MAIVIVAAPVVPVVSAYLNRRPGMRVRIRAMQHEQARILGPMPVVAAAALEFAREALRDVKYN